jgi:hypothetical protein
VLVLLLATPAAATCLSPTFDSVVADSDAIWWGTVTGAASKLPPGNLAGGGEWNLTIHVLQTLKGAPVPTSLGHVQVSSCGPVLSSAETDREATRFVGRTQLFLLSRAGGRLSEGNYYGFSVAAAPTGMTPQQQYARAAVDLGLSPDARFVGPGKPWTRWLLVGLGLAAAAVAVVAWGHARSPRAL